MVQLLCLTKVQNHNHNQFKTNRVGSNTLPINQIPPHVYKRKKTTYSLFMVLSGMYSYKFTNSNTTVKSLCKPPSFVLHIIKSISYPSVFQYIVLHAHLHGFMLFRSVSYTINTLSIPKFTNYAIKIVFFPVSLTKTAVVLHFWIFSNGDHLHTSSNCVLI